MRQKKILLLTLIFLSCFFISSKASAREWYIDNAATGSNNGTSWANAWTSFAGIIWGNLGVTAGDTIYISGGSSSKTYTEALTIKGSGAAGNHITIKPGSASLNPTGHNGKVIISNPSGSGINITSKNYIKIDGQYGSLKNILLQHNGNSGIYIYGENSNIILSYLDFYHNGETTGGSSWEKNGILTNLSGSVSGLVLDANNCDIHDNYQDGIHLLGTSGPDEYDRMLIHNNHIYNTNDDWMETGLFNGISIFNNEFNSLVITGGAGHPDGIQTNGSSYLKIYNNYFHDFYNYCKVANSYMLPSGFTSTVAKEVNYVRIYNNLIYEPPGGTKHCDYGLNGCVANSDCTARLSGGAEFGSTLRGIEITSDATDSSVQAMRHWLIANNTLIGVKFYSLSFFAKFGPENLDDIVFVNNLIYRSGVAQKVALMIGSGTFTVGSWGDGTDVIFDYNLVHPGPDGGSNMSYKGTYYSSYSSGKAAAGIQDHDFNSPAADPLLGTDYRLLTNSPGINSGIPLNNYFNADKNGLIRGNIWDIGAYKYSGSQAVDTTPPSAPTGIKIN